MNYTVYTDGCLMNAGLPGDKLGGWAAWFSSHNTAVWGTQFPTESNQQMELVAVIKALEQTEPNSHVKVLTDWDLLADIERLDEWARRGWLHTDGTVIKDMDLWQSLQRLFDERHVEFEWIKGHSGVKGNIVVDYLAQLVCHLGDDYDSIDPAHAYEIAEVTRHSGYDDRLQILMQNGTPYYLPKGLDIIRAKPRFYAAHPTLKMQLNSWEPRHLVVFGNTIDEIIKCIRENAERPLPDTVFLKEITGPRHNLDLRPPLGPIARLDFSGSVLIGAVRLKQDFWGSFSARIQNGRWSIKQGDRWVPSDAASGAYKTNIRIGERFTLISGRKPSDNITVDVESISYTTMFKQRGYSIRTRGKHGVHHIWVPKELVMRVDRDALAQKR